MQLVNNMKYSFIDSLLKIYNKKKSKYKKPPLIKEEAF